MKAAEMMTRNVFVIAPNHSVRAAALLMSQHDIGALPVREKDHLVGMVTDRDIAIRGVGDGRAVDTKVRDVMTKDVKFCFADDEIESVCANMTSNNLRRLPVLDRDRHLIGILCLGDLALSHNAIAGQVLAGIYRTDKTSTAA